MTLAHSYWELLFGELIRINILVSMIPADYEYDAYQLKNPVIDVIYQYIDASVDNTSRRAHISVISQLVKELGYAIH